MDGSVERIVLKIITRLKQKLLSFFIFRNCELSAFIFAQIPSLPSKTCGVLLKRLLDEDLSLDSVSQIVCRLTSVDGTMRKEQREEMLAYLLSQPISRKQQEMMVSVCKVDQISKQARATLWERLSQYPVPSENISSIIHALIESKVMQKEQREEMLAYLLSQPISRKQQEMMMSVCKVDQISKQARENLWKSLSQYPIPEESVSSVVHVLIDSKVMWKEQREEMLSYLLSCPLSAEQIKECILKVIDFSNNKIFEISKILDNYFNFRNAMDNLTPWIDEDRLEWKNGKKIALKRVLFENVDPQEVLLDLICIDNICYLKDACIEFIDRKQLWLMMEELLFSEEYYCQFSHSAPYVLDCGTNIGLAIYYIKHYYPEAHIEGFEPWKTAFDCAVRNVERNAWKNVTIHHAAVGKQENVMQLTVVAENSLAGSLVGRLDEMIKRKHWKKSVENVKVVKLSDYINRPVDFIKMDIEGLENVVLEEIREKLTNVSQIFIEYHYAPNMKDNSLREILNILSDSGFIYEVSKSRSYTELTKQRPFNHVGKIVSELIWAKKSNPQNI